MCIPFRTINAAKYSFVTDKGNEVFFGHRGGVVGLLDIAFTAGVSLGRGPRVFLGTALDWNERGKARLTLNNVERGSGLAFCVIV